jgi:hypothetical protein
MTRNAGLSGPGSSTTVKILNSKQIFQLHVFALKYCCSTLCQYIGVGKFALGLRAFAVVTLIGIHLDVMTLSGHVEKNVPKNKTAQPMGAQHQ